jgi:hypothetical protein
MSEEKLEQNQREQPMTTNGKVIITAITAGVLWGLLGYMAYFFNFTKLGPALVLGPWAVGEWKDEVIGQFIGILFIAGLSIPVAFIYKVVLAKIPNMLVGVGYGIALWFLVFYVLNPLFPDLKSVSELGMNTNITTICLYSLYGVFIGYSISFDYEEMNRQKAEPNYSK